MEIMACSDAHQYKQANLPQLRFTQDISRRDSITSSKTGDSGYNSDPDISLSPLDFIPEEKLVGSWKPELAAFGNSTSERFELPIHHESGNGSTQLRKSRGSCSSLLLKKFGDGKKLPPPSKTEVTSNPAICPPPSANKSDWTKAFKFSQDDSVFKPSDGPIAEANYDISEKGSVEIWIDQSFPAHDRPKERVSSIVSVSSTGSGGDYSVTDDSDAEEPSDLTCTMLSKATLKTIELVMRKIEVNLTYAAYVQCANGPNTRKPSTGEVSRGARGTGQSSNSKRKSRGDDTLQPEDNDDDGPTKRRRTSVTTTEDSEAGPRFACPFFKHDPNRYRNQRTCPGPGWPTVHRMKEHLYRSHPQPIFCARCYAMFDTDGDLSFHLRSEPCQMATRQPVEGIDRETMNRLRKRSPALRLEEDKWRDVYHMLFPEVPEADIPSPYYDSDSPSEESRRFRRELLRRIREELFATAEQEEGSAEQNLLRRVAEIIQRCERDLLQSFHAASALLQNSSARRRPATGHPVGPHPTDLPSSPHLDPTRPHDPIPGAEHPSAPMINSSSPLGMEQSPIMDSEESEHGVPRYCGIPSGEYPPFEWDDTLDWVEVDWNAVFPPVPDAQISERSGPMPRMTTPVFT